MIVFWLCLLAAVAALVGGHTAIRNREKLNLALGLTGGLIIGLVAFDLLPEIFRTAQVQIDIRWPMIALVAGFLLFHIAEKTILIHGGHEADYDSHTHPNVGLAGAAGLIGHSFLDGITIGVAFQAGSAVLVPVAIAVIGHRFIDGFNTTNLMIVHKNLLGRTKKVLWLAAMAPILGGLATTQFTLHESSLAIYLGFFAGFLLYIGASDILPQAHSKGSSWKTIIMTIFGVTLIYLITSVT